MIEKLDNILYELPSEDAEFGRFDVDTVVDRHWRYIGFFRALQFSQSYWAYHRYAETVEAERPPLSDDLKKVRSIYKLFGSVWSETFWEWWQRRASYQFIPKAPRPLQVGITNPKRQPEADELHAMNATLQAYFSEEAKYANWPATMVIAIPLSGDRRSILNELNGMLDRHWQDKPKARRSFRFLKNNVRRKTIATALTVARARAFMGSSQLYSIGYHVGLGNYDLDESVKFDYSDSRRELSMLTSRHIRRARILSENAARGRFPSFEAPSDESIWPAEDYDSLRWRLSYYDLVASKSQGDG